MAKDIESIEVSVNGTRETLNLRDGRVNHDVISSVEFQIIKTSESTIRIMLNCVKPDGSAARSNTLELPSANEAKAGLMSAVQYSKLAWLDKVLSTLTGVADERSLDIYMNWNSEVTSMREMFKNDKTLVYFPKVDTSKVTDMYCAFESSNLEQIANIDTSSVINATGLFYACRYMRSAPSLDLSNATETSEIFKNCGRLVSVPPLDLGNSTNLWGLFENCSSLGYIPEINTSKAVTMRSMLMNTAITEVSTLDTSSAEDISYLFYGCKSLVQVSGLDTAKAKDWSGMFNYCTNLSHLQELDMSSATTLGGPTSGYGTFANCTHLLEITVRNTSNISNLGYAFYNCTKVSTIGTIDLSSASNMYGCFLLCQNLKNLKLINLGTQKEVRMTSAFSHCLWGSGSEENRQSLVDSLLTYSFDRAAAGYAELALQLEPEVLARLTDEEIAAITAKGYTLTSY